MEEAVRRIIHAADSTFRYYNPDEGADKPIMSEPEWFQNARHGPDPGAYNIDDHEAAEDAHDLGFVTPNDQPHRLYRVDKRGTIYEIYPRGESNMHTPEEKASNPRWMTRVTNIPETPDLFAKHHTLEDAIEAMRSGSWGRNYKVPRFDTYHEETKALPTGTPFTSYPWSRVLDPEYRHESGDPWQPGTAQARFLGKRQEEINAFHDAWNSGDHSPYTRIGKIQS